MSRPGSWTTSTSGPSRSRSASSGVRSSGTGRLADPPPMITARPALGPITATRRKRSGLQRERTVVAQEHHRRGGRLSGDGAVLGQVLRPGLLGRVVVEGADAVEHPEQAQHGGIHEGLVDRARPHLGGQGRPVGPAGARHLEVEAGPDRLGAVGEGEPVGDHESVEAPVPPQDPAEQRLAVGAVLTVEAVVGGHDAERTALGHRHLERQQMDLAEGALVDDRIGEHPLVLGLVAGEVLHRAGHPLGLGTPHEGGTEAAGQQRVLRVALEVATTERRPVEVDRGGEQHPARLHAGLRPDHRADPVEEIDVPGGAQRRTRWHAQRGHRGPGPHSGGKGRAARTVGPVGDPDRRDAEALDRHRRPQVGAREQGGLLVEVQRSDQCAQVTGHGALLFPLDARDRCRAALPSTPGTSGRALRPIRRR